MTAPLTDVINSDFYSHGYFADIKIIEGNNRVPSSDNTHGRTLYLEAKSQVMNKW